MEGFNKPPLVYREDGVSAKFEVEKIIGDLENSLSSCLEQLRNSIENHELGGVLGIDGSGRVPALILWKTINTIYQKQNDETNLFANFVQGSRFGFDFNEAEKIKTYFSTLKTKLQGKKLLVVDDTIQRGGSVGSIISILDECSIEHEVVTLGVILHDYDGERTVEDLEEKIGSRIIYSEEGMSPIYGKKKMSGVHKNSESIFAAPYYKDEIISDFENTIPSTSNYGSAKDYKPKEFTYSNSEIVARTRGLAYEAAERIAEKFVSEK